MQKLIEYGYKCNRLSRSEKLIIGNGSYGYRGTLEENRKEDFVALNASNFYDQVSKDLWRESVNFPNPLYSVLYINGIELNENIIIDHKEELNLDNGTFKRVTKFNINGIKGTLESIRFILDTRYDTLISQYKVHTDNKALITVKSGIDYDPWSINGNHFNITKKSYNPISLEAITNEGENLSLYLYQNSNADKVLNLENDKIIYNDYQLSGCDLIIDKMVILSHSNLINKPYNIDFDVNDFIKENDNSWNKRWLNSRVTLKGEKELSLAVNYSIYQLLICSPKVDGISIPARGVTSQTYKGAIFWDTEMFMVPFYLATDIEACKRLVKYRINTLDGALNKAKEYGYEGAFYAWESQDSGIEGCSEFNVTDVFTLRKIRTYFKDKQIHISGAVALSIYNVYKKSKDISLLLDGGLKTMIECSKFFYSYSYYNHMKNRFELLDVIGPDEYHERVNNNAYTNYIAHETALRTIELFKYVKKDDRFKLIINENNEFINKLKKFVKMLYLPLPNENGVIEQFDGYYILEDTSIETVKSRMIDKNEYMGGSNGVCTPTRIIKQADVVALLALLPDRFSKEIKKANYDYYLKYTEHGSSLSQSMYSLCAIDIGYLDHAYNHLLDTAKIDLLGRGKKYAGTIYIGGSHLASAGGTWLILKNGFKDHNVLPKEIEKLKINLERVR